MLLHIEINWDTKHFRMNSSKYTILPEEEEILINDGTGFYVVSVNKVNKNYQVKDQNNKQIEITCIHLT